MRSDNGTVLLGTLVDPAKRLNRSGETVVRPRNHAVDGVDIGATWRIRLSDLCITGPRPSSRPTDSSSRWAKKWGHKLMTIILSNLNRLKKSVDYSLVNLQLNTY